MNEIAAGLSEIAWFIGADPLHETQGRHYPEDQPCWGRDWKRPFTRSFKVTMALCADASGSMKTRTVLRSLSCGALPA